MAISFTMRMPGRLRPKLARRLAFKLGKFRDPTAELRFRTELRSQKGRQNLFDYLNANNLGPNAEQIDVVMLDRLVSRVGVMANRGSYSRDLVACDTSSDPSAADE